MPDLDHVTDLDDLEIVVVDAAAPYAHLPAEQHLAMFRHPYDGPDYRFEVRGPGVGRLSLWAGATAADVVSAVRRAKVAP